MNDNIKKTALYDYHKENSNNVIDFSGFLLPVFYSSILEEHQSVRKTAGIFDVSHMGQLFISGKSSEKFLQMVTTNDVSKLKKGQAQYSAICNEEGGVIDDIIVYKRESDYMLVVNASDIDKKFEWLKSFQLKETILENRSKEYSMIALQGPKSRKIIQNIIKDDISKIKFYQFVQKIDCLGYDILLSRTGYTGELGFEIYCSHNAVKYIWSYILDNFKDEGVKPAGLGCRDTLRLEMGYHLYGNDLNIYTDPFMAGLGWITNLKKREFIGKDKISSKKISQSTCLIYFIMVEKSIARPGCEIIVNEKVIGKVTSGTISPSLNFGIGIGYVNKDYSRKGSSIFIKIRKKIRKAKIVKAPFYKKGTLNI